jgi:hypothetical protein
MVVVLLILSLVVQSIQSGLKKLLKIKSRQIEDSLIDLFEHVLNKAPASGSFLQQSPILRILFWRKHPSESADPQVKHLYDDVLKKFRELGRVAQSGESMLDSLSKEDLLKVLEKIAPNALTPQLTTSLQAVSDQITVVRKTLESITPDQLPGDTSAKFSDIQATLFPLLNDFNAIVTGTSIKPDVLIGDVINLRQLKLQDAVSTLGEIQAKIEKDLAAARAAATPAGAQPTAASALADASVPTLQKLAGDFNSVAQAITNLRTEFDSAIAPLRGKLKEVESWFDTVMQSFDERYARGMKTWAIVISLAVVVLLNANFFTIYQKISTNEVVRNSLVQSQAKLKELEDAGKDKPAEAKSLDGIIKETSGHLNQEAAAYAAFGFQPLSRQQVSNWVEGKGPWSLGWCDRLVHMAKIAAGWMLMTLLLSVGAPFWEDTLESLFGLKSLLRAGSETKNIERKSGAGQPKT